MTSRWLGMAQRMIVALRGRFGRARHTRRPVVSERLGRLSDDFQSLPVRDDRSPDDIIGYDEDGLPR
jgi:antitoxin VapB